MRTGLVIWTLLATALCIGSVLATQTQQESSAATMLHAQDLRDLRSAVAKTHATGLSLMTSPMNSDLIAAYDQVRSTTDHLILASAGSYVGHGDMGSVISSIRTWQDDLAVSLHIISNGSVDPLRVSLLDTEFRNVTTAIDQAYSSVSVDATSTTPFIIIGIIASVLGGLGFVMVSVVTARRSRRIINPGLTIGLLAVIAAIVTVGFYASKSAEISVVDSRISAFSQAQADTWTSRAQVAMGVLDPDQWSTHLTQAQTTAHSIQPTVMKVVAFIDSDLEEGFTTLSSAVDSLVTDSSSAPHTLSSNLPWLDLAQTLSNLIDDERLTEDNLVVPAMWYTALLALLCVVAVVFLLSGLHSRTKEYL
jgi:hypothetical protein